MSRSSPVGRARAIGDYAGTLRSIVHALKYGKHQSLAPRLADRMAASGRDVLDGADAVVPVPLHWVRRWRRGFNQADLLAERLDLPVWRALRRVRSTPSQVALGAPQRRANVRGAFALARRLPLKARSHRRIAIGPAARARFPASAWNRDAWSTRLEGKVVVLVDDVSTTGATLEACAKVLLAAGAREVRALTAARVVEGRKGQGDVNNIRNCSVTTE